MYDNSFEMENIIQHVLAKLDIPEEESSQIKETDFGAEEARIQKTCNLTEFVGTTKFGDTIGLVIANVDRSLLEKMKLEKKYYSIGIVGARIGAGSQIFAADEAVKATNTEIISIELPRDAKGGAGHGSLIIFGGDDVSDVKRAVETTLKVIDTRTFGDVYTNDVGQIELQYTARASYACNKAWAAPIGKACGVIIGAPAAIGIIMADTALKSANVEIVAYQTPQHGQSFSNEVTLVITGDSGAVRQAVVSAREVGNKLLGTLGTKPANNQPSYI